MAVRIEPDADIEFGTMGAAVDVTAVRVRPTASTSDAILRRLASTLSVPNGSALQIPAGSFDVVIPSGEIGNDFMEWLVTQGWSSSTSMQVDCMTGNAGSETPVTTTGYSQQTVTAWTVSTEAD